MNFKEWIKKNNSIISELYDTFNTICLKKNIVLYDDFNSRKEFAYMLYVNSMDKIELPKELYEPQGLYR